MDPEIKDASALETEGARIEESAPLRPEFLVLDPADEAMRRVRIIAEGLENDEMVTPHAALECQVAQTLLLERLVFAVESHLERTNGSNS